MDNSKNFNENSLINSDGFLIDFNMWNETMAKTLAEKMGILEMTEDHWKLIYYLREYVFRHKYPPLIKELCKDTGYSLLDIYALFPKSHLIGLYKVSGLYFFGRCQ